MTAWPRLGSRAAGASGGRAAWPEPSVLANLFAQSRQWVRLEEILIAAGPFGLFWGCHAGRVHDHLDIRGVLARPDSPAELQPIDAGHLDVRDDHGGLVLDADLPGLVAVSGFHDLMAIELEEGPKHGPDVEVVVGDQHRGEVADGFRSRDTALTESPHHHSARILGWLTISGQGLIVSRFSARDDVGYRVTARHHLTRDEPAVAAKPDNLRAHDAGGRAGDQTFEAVQPGGKRRGGHVSLVAAFAKAAQVLIPDIRDAAAGQLPRQHILGHLRGSAGAPGGGHAGQPAQAAG